MQTLYEEFKGKEYLEQWERVGRWYEKLLLVKHGYYKNESHKDLLDIVYIYFMNIQHLKDWVVNSKKELKTEVLMLFQEPCFVICADFINNHKHLERNEQGKRNAKDPEASIKHQHVIVTVGTARFATTASGSIECVVQEKVDRIYAKGAQYRWDIVHEGQKHDAYKLAKDCFDTWYNFLSKNHLLKVEVGDS